MNDNEIKNLSNFESNSILEIEKIVLSIVINKGQDYDEVFINLKSEDFFDYNCRVIFIILEKFREEGKDIDLFSVIDYIDQNPECQFDSYKEYILDINLKFSYQQNIKQLLDIIKNASIKRQIDAFAQTLQSTNFDVLSAKEKLWNLEKDFLNITNNKKSKEIESLSKILIEYQKKIDQLMNLDDSLIGITSGYISVDKLTNGFQGGDLIILAARPGIGKTTLAINFLVNAAKELKEKNTDSNTKEKIVLMFSMEMGNLQVCQKIVSLESDVEIGMNKKVNLNEIQKRSISNAISNLYSFPLYIDDTSDLSIIDVQSKIKQLSANKEIKLIVLDYLQLLKSSSKNSAMNRQQEVAYISRTLKSIARQFDVPIIAIAQLSRKIEERKGDAKKPLLSDLRESGSIEQDADLVCFISPKEIQDNTQNENQLNATNIVVEFIIAKNRNGATGTAELFFVKPLSKYYDATAVRKS
ncbi:MAG: replicative DNA helicase [Malacoplasma sp.]|nr:replicative DNA helicase [Malacoplasma sp.]